MRKEDAIYGGEMSAHHYFRDFAYCDSGMIPWLLVAELVCLKGKTLGELVRDRCQRHQVSGVGQLIDHHHRVARFVDDITHQRRANKPGTTCYQNLSHQRQTPLASTTYC